MTAKPNRKSERRYMGCSGRDTTRSYLGRSASVPASKAGLKGGADGETRPVRAEVSRGRSSHFDGEGPKGASKYVPAKSRGGVFSEDAPPTGGQSFAAMRSIQWLGAGFRTRFKTRTQPPSADPHARWCGRGPGQPGPYPDVRPAWACCCGVRCSEGALSPLCLVPVFKWEPGYQMDSS